MKVLLHFILLVILQFECSDFYEYCINGIEQKLCLDARHTLCAPDPLKCFEKETDTISERLVGLAPMTPKMVRIYLERHNYYRNLVASGTQVNSKINEKYPPAGRMREVRWDWELSFLAHNHAKFVRMGHDICRSTLTHGNCGQNLGFLGFEFEAPILKTLNTSMYEFFMEKELVEDPFIMAGLFTLKYLDVNAGHFTQLVSDRCAHIGCAFALGYNCQTNSGPMEYCYYAVCHYDFPNVNGSQVYTHTDKSAVRCADWETTKSDDFEHLCKNNGKLYTRRFPKPPKSKKPKNHK